MKLGIKNIHVHKGPTILPLNRDAFDVADVDDAATSFQSLNFIVEHCGLPRLDDFCWIATQETNVYGGLAVVLPFIHSRPAYFAKVISELLFWIGEDKILYGSDYGIWSPKWLVEKFMEFELPEDVSKETGVALTLESKKKFLASTRRGFMTSTLRRSSKAAPHGSHGRVSLDNTEAARIEAVRAALAEVTDPELDESVVDLGFVTDLKADASGRVFIGFRLPTYWCAANFAFLMAEDMRNAAQSLPWVTEVRLRLDAHMYGDAINDGIGQGKSFDESFPNEADAGLDDVRRIFLLKSFQRRQEALLRHLLNQGFNAAALAMMTLDALSGLALGSVGLNAEFNGALCRGLLAARYGETSHELPAEPELIDFIRASPQPIN